MSVMTRPRISGNPRVLQNAGQPSSGTSGTLAGAAQPGALLWDTTNSVLYWNEGTLASPYWSPVGYDQENLLAYRTDFRAQNGKAVADNAAEAILPDSGFRVFGQGIEEADSGLVVAISEGGAVATLTSTNQASHLAAIGLEAGVWQPDTHGVLVIDAEFAVLADLDTKTVGIGFIGTAADALDPPVTCATTTLTLVQDDVALAIMDAALTDAVGIMLAHNKSDEAASLATTDTGVDTGEDIEAAGTYQRMRVEMVPDGAGAVVMNVFKDKVLIGTIADALDEDEECSPVLYIGSGTTSTEALGIKRIAAWAQRA